MVGAQFLYPIAQLLVISYGSCHISAPFAQHDLHTQPLKFCDMLRGSAQGELRPLDAFQL